LAISTATSDQLVTTLGEFAVRHLYVVLKPDPHVRLKARLHDAGDSSVPYATSGKLAFAATRYHGNE